MRIIKEWYFKDRMKRNVKWFMQGANTVKIWIFTYPELHFLNFQVSNPLAAVCNVGAYMHSTNLLVATSLRNVLGTKVSFIHEPSLFFYPELIGFLKISYVSAGIWLRKFNCWTQIMYSINGFEFSDISGNSIWARNDMPPYGKYTWWSYKALGG